MKNLLLIFILFCNSVSYSQEVLACGQIHNYEEPPIPLDTERGYYEYEVRLNNQCHDEVLFKFDFATINIPDRFQILKPYSDDVLVDSEWYWCNADFLTYDLYNNHCNDGFTVFGINGEKTYYGNDPSIYPFDYKLKSPSYGQIKGKGRFEFITDEDVFIIRIYPHFTEYTVGHYYLHCSDTNIENNEELCIIETWSEDTICSNVQLDTNIIAYTYYVDCCDSIVYYYYQYVENNYFLKDTTVCPNTDMILENPYKDSLNGNWSTESDIIYLDQDTIVYFNGYDDTGCTHILPKRIDVYGEEYYYIENEYHVQRNKPFIIDFCGFDIYNIFINGEPINSCWYEYSTLESTSLMLYFEDSNGCLLEREIFIYVHIGGEIYKPNVFSPNEDGKNDVFKIYGKDGYISFINYFMVFDRWGDKVFQQLNLDWEHLGWNGRYNGSGELMGSAVYVYYAEIINYNGEIEIIKGDVTLIR